MSDLEIDREIKKSKLVEPSRVTYVGACVGKTSWHDSELQIQLNQQWMQ